MPDQTIPWKISPGNPRQVLCGPNVVADCACAADAEVAAAGPDMLAALRAFIVAYESNEWTFTEKFRGDAAYRLAKAAVSKIAGAPQR